MQAGRQRQENHKFKVIISYHSNIKANLVYKTLSLKEKKKAQIQIDLKLYISQYTFLSFNLHTMNMPKILIYLNHFMFIEMLVPKK